MKKVYFVRHGQSEGNVGPLRQTALTPLTEAGKRQASIVALRCFKLPVDAIISSTMARARETADIINAKVKKPIEYSDLFTECRPPSAVLNQLKDSDIVMNVEREMREKFHLPGFRHSDEENFEDLKSRTAAALAYLAARPEKNILVVTHGLFLRMVLTHVVHGENVTGDECVRFLRTFYMENTGITVLGYDEKEGAEWRVWIWNDHNHLESI